MSLPLVTNPALWAGALALAVPLLLHWLTRRTARTLVFPSVRFIRAVQASQSAFYRLRHLLLLLVRTALLALLLAAFLKPVLRLHSLSPAGGPGRQAVVLVLDASASMGYTGGGATPFTRGRAAARKLLDDLDDGDLVNLILAGATAAPSFDAPAANRFHLRNDLDRARLTDERADLDAALAEAVKQLAAVSGYKKEIQFISDFQRSNWAPVRFDRVPADVRVVFVSVAPADPANLAITDVVLQPPAPALGEEIEVVARIANYGARARTAPVHLKFGDEKPMERNVDVPAGGSAGAGFRFKVRRAGIFEGELSIPDDGLAADDRRYFTLTVGERVQVLVVSDEDAADPGAGSRYLARAIHPGPDRGGALNPVPVASAQLDRFALAGANLVILEGARDLGPAAAGVLAGYLKDGGSVIWMLAGPGDVTGLAALARAAGGDLRLPFRPGGWLDRGAPGDSGFATLTEANFDEPMLKAFQETRDLGEIHFQKYLATEREAGQGQVLLRYDDRNIALARTSLGAGSLLLANFSAATRQGDLAKRTLFVPLLHEMIKAMRPRSGAARPFVVGQAASATVPLRGAGRDVRFASPSGAWIDAVFETGRDEAAVIFPETTERGFYRVLAGERVAGSVAVNLDPRESNLESLSLPQMQALSELARERTFAAPGTDVEALRRLREGRPIWHYCLLGAMMLLGLETALTLVWRK